MRNFVFVLLLSQLFFCFLGVQVFGIYVNAFFFFFSSLAIAYFYFASVLYRKENKNPDHEKNLKPLIGGLLFGILMAVIFIMYVIRFHKFHDTNAYSDVLMQLEALYDRFARGEQPYYPVNPPAHSPFPVYMPLHWLPIGFARLFNVDLRVIGLLILYIAVGLYAYYFIDRNKNVWSILLVIVMPVAILLSFFYSLDLVYVFETPIAAYYLLLALGLARRNMWLTTLGIILCLLSRYTMVFWLPIFAVLLFMNVSRRQAFMLFGTIILSVVLIYILPFYLRAPDALADGLRYHNRTVISGWEYGADTLRIGVYFAPHMRALFSGTAEHRVFCARVVQALVMLLLFIGGMIAYTFNRKRINFYDFSLGMLYLVLLCFYTIGPMIFIYYLLSLFFVGIVLCARIIENTESVHS